MRFAFISTRAATSFGGSDLLWLETATRLAERGHQIHVGLMGLMGNHPRLAGLTGHANAILEDFCSHRSLGFKNNFPYLVRKASAIPPTQQVSRVASHKPDLLVISQGANMDGAAWIAAAESHGLPFCIISQMAGEPHWPGDGALGLARNGYQKAKRAFFVSKHNLELTQHQLGVDLPNGQVISNPFQVDHSTPLPWPTQQEPTRLACVARITVAAKGQDVLLRVLARDQWRNRNIETSLFGHGDNVDSIRRMAGRLGLGNVHFPGYCEQVADIWRDHHALVLPSRYEGLPIALVEACLAGRPAIVADAGGSKEVIDDGVTGFVASAATEDLFCAALDRAWQRRQDWQQMGLAAAGLVRGLVPRNPAATFADQLEGLVTAS